MTDETDAGRLYFNSVPHSMCTLVLHATLLDSPSVVLKDIGTQNWPAAVLFGVFIFLSAMLLLNILIGVLCEVVSGVSAIEKELITESFVREKVGHVLQQVDANCDGQISKDELLSVLLNADARKHLKAAGVDVAGLIDA